MRSACKAPKRICCHRTIEHCSVLSTFPSLLLNLISIVNHTEIYLPSLFSAHSCPRGQEYFYSLENVQFQYSYGFLPFSVEYINHRDTLMWNLSLSFCILYLGRVVKITGNQQMAGNLKPQFGFPQPWSCVFTGSQITAMAPKYNC